MLNRCNKHVGFNDKWLLIGGIPAITILMTLIMFGADWETYFSVLHLCLPISLVYVITFWIILRKIYIRFHILFPQPKQLQKRLFFLASSMLVLYFILKNVIKQILIFLVPASEGLHGKQDQGADIATIMIIFLVTSIYELLYFLQSVKTIRN